MVIYTRAIVEPVFFALNTTAHDYLLAVKDPIVTIKMDLIQCPGMAYRAAIGHIGTTCFATESIRSDDNDGVLYRVRAIGHGVL